MLLIGALKATRFRSGAEGQLYGTLREVGRWPFHDVNSTLVPVLLSLIKM